MLHDALVLELPPELASIMRRPPPGWAEELLDQLCTVARAAEARPDERAFAPVMLFETIRIGLGLAAYQTNGAFEGFGGSRRDLDRIAAKELERLLQVPLALDAATSYRPLVVTMAAAMVRLTEHLEGFRAVQSVTQELCDAIRDRAELEMLLRKSDPVDATILRHQYDRADHLQPIPVSRLPLEHPLVLAGHTDASIYQRGSRARKMLEQSPDILGCTPTRVTLPELCSIRRTPMRNVQSWAGIAAHLRRQSLPACLPAHPDVASRTPVRSGPDAQPRASGWPTRRLAYAPYRLPRPPCPRVRQLLHRTHRPSKTPMRSAWSLVRGCSAHRRRGCVRRARRAHARGDRASHVRGSGDRWRGRCASHKRARDRRLCWRLSSAVGIAPSYTGRSRY
jgi:hypothetical protein